MTLTVEELGFLRQEAEGWMSDTADIFKVTEADDPFGGRSRTHPADATYAGVPCSLESGVAHEQERVLVGQLEEIQVFSVDFPAETDVYVGDHLVVHSNEDVHLHVRATISPETQEIERRVICTEVGDEVHA